MTSDVNVLWSLNVHMQEASSAHLCSLLTDEARACAP
jgi:hypothetical protein